MRLSRRFRPAAPAALDGRVLPSGAFGNILNIPPVKLTPAEITQSNASDAAFGMTTSATIHAGLPVAEQLTTTYNDGSTQTESLLKVPNPANNSVTTYNTTNLRHDGGTETVVDVVTYSGSTTPFSGTSETQTITTTMADGAVQAETETETLIGHKTLIDATIHEANGTVETSTSVNIKHGRTTIAHKTIFEPYGTVEHQTTTTTDVGKLDSTSRTVTTFPGEIEVVTSATSVTRVQPPTS